MIIKWQRVRKLYVASTNTHLHLVMFLMLFFFSRPSRGFALHIAKLCKGRRTHQGDQMRQQGNRQIQQLYTPCTSATSFGHTLLHPLAMLGFVEPYGGPCRRSCARFTHRKWRMSMRVRNIAVGSGLVPWLCS